LATTLYVWNIVFKVSNYRHGKGLKHADVKSSRFNAERICT
jgi:hypothetical protein